jgi:hypothetical protein
MGVPKSDAARLELEFKRLALRLAGKRFALGELAATATDIQFVLDSVRELTRVAAGEVAAS